MMSRLVLLSMVMLVALAAPAQADDSEDLRALGEALHVQLNELSAKPEPGWDGRRQYAWRVYLKPRGARMMRRVRQLLDGTWVFDEDNVHAKELDPAQWRTAIQALASLHTELSAANKGYGRINVSEKPALKNWDRAHPMPKSITGTPSYSALYTIRSDIAYYRRMRYVIPTSWYDRERALVRVCQAELKEQQEAWKVTRATAHKNIRAEAEATREALRQKRDLFGGAAKTAYDWMALMQASEENRLREQTSELEGEPRKQADKLLLEMARGRFTAKGRRFTSDARYGAKLRQRWAGPRNKILALLKKTHQEQKEPDK